MRSIWAVEVFSEKRANNGYTTAEWCAWEDYFFETRARARQAVKSHKKSCHTKTRIVKYVPEKP
jgi:hypothetical protein